MHFLPILSTMVTFAFMIAVFNRYLRRRGAHLLLWSIGLLFYGLGTFSEVILGFTYNELVLKVWYFSGAMLTAAWLGQGTIHLLVRRKGVASVLTGVLVVVSLLSVGLTLAAPATAAVGYDIAQPASAQYRQILERSGLVIGLTIFLNIYGTFGLVGGALYSAFLFWRKQVLFDRMVGNLLIAAGALMPAMAGSFVKAGLFDWLYLSELLGVIIMFIGFIRATSGSLAEAPKPVSVTSTPA